MPPQRLVGKPQLAALREAWLKYRKFECSDAYAYKDRPCSRAGIRGTRGDGLAKLNMLSVDVTAAHQPYWVRLAHLLGLCVETALRQTALEREAGLTQERRVREHLLAQLSTET